MNFPRISQIASQPNEQRIGTAEPFDDEDVPDTVIETTNPQDVTVTPDYHAQDHPVHLHSTEPAPMDNNLHNTPLQQQFNCADFPTQTSQNTGDEPQINLPTGLPADAWMKGLFETASQSYAREWKEYFEAQQEQQLQHVNGALKILEAKMINQQANMQEKNDSMLATELHDMLQNCENTLQSFKIHTTKAIDQSRDSIVAEGQQNKAELIEAVQAIATEQRDNQEELKTAIETTSKDVQHLTAVMHGLKDLMITSQEAQINSAVQKALHAHIP